MAVAEGPAGYLGIAKQTTPGTAVKPLPASAFALGAVVRRKKSRRVNPMAIGKVIAGPSWAALMAGKPRVRVEWMLNGLRTRVLESELEEVEVVAGGQHG
jgi:hypothetical protein